MLSHRTASMTSCTSSRSIRFSCSTASRATFSSTSSRRSYDDTIQNLRIGRHTRVICQGITGKLATANALQSLAWGTQFVGGVKPNSHGKYLGLPLFPTVLEAKEQLKPDATAIYVAAHGAAKAIEYAIEAEIPLIVAVAEHVPLHDILRIHSMLSTQSKSRLVGANAPGIISPIGHCRIGFQPLPCYSPGHVGIVAKSGTLSYEAAASTTRAGLGQSLCIAMGGDVIAGTNFVDALKVLEHDPDTKGIVIVGEVGGHAEEEAAEWIKEYRKRAATPKPIAALVAGKLAAPGRVMGHAGAWAAQGENSADAKAKILEDAGAVMVNHPDQFGNVMKELLAKSGGTAGNTQPSAASATDQRRSYHTSRRPCLPLSTSFLTNTNHQRRNYHLTPRVCTRLLNERGVKANPHGEYPDSRLITMTIDRSTRSPAFVVFPSLPPDAHARGHSIPFDYRTGPTSDTLMRALAALNLDNTRPITKRDAEKLLKKLWVIFNACEAVNLTIKIAPSAAKDCLHIYSPSFTLDDAAVHSAQRQSTPYSKRDTTPSAIDPAELAAEKHGLVYIKLGTDHHNIGILSNGAGLAMNTIDALAAAPHHGLAANFLDTGGKATPEPVRESLQLLTADPRVRVVFVNVFGGLTQCDVIANSIVEVHQAMGLKVPLVVRLRGAKEQAGQQVLNESGLKDVWVYGAFDKAAKKCVELAKRGEAGEV